MAALQKEAKRDNELLHRKDEELHHRRGPSPVISHSRGDESVLGDRIKKRDMITIHPHRERKQTLHREIMVSLPLGRTEGKSKKGRGIKALFLSIQQSRVPVTPSISGGDAMSKVL